jgi:hypothetical protein
MQLMIASRRQVVDENDLRQMKRHLRLNAFVVLTLLSSLLAADNPPQVTLDVSKASPRSVEALTQRAIIRDYKFAWANLDSAFQSNSAGPLNGLFAGTANAWLKEAVSSQQSSGITSHYLNQNHKLDAVFYAPVGDVIELPTSWYDLKSATAADINEHAIVQYVVLMTPGADRWVIRQLQAVPQF